MYKNWKTICQIPDAHFRWALALLDIETDFGRQIIERFPDCFTEEDQAGPYPLSFLRREANMDARKAGAGDDLYDDLAVHGTCERFDIPTTYFGSNNPMPADLAKLLEGIESDDGIGQIVEWEGKKIVVVDNALPLGVYLAPAELIAVDR